MKAQRIESPLSIDTDREELNLAMKEFFTAPLFRV